MNTIITEEMRFREKVVKFALKNNNYSEAARRYHTSRQQVRRWAIKYDGTTKSLANKSTRPKSHPNAHTQEEIELIKEMYKRHKFEGLAQVYRKLLDKGYKRTYESMQRQIKKFIDEPKKKPTKYPKSRFKPLKGEYPGQFVEIDVKYVPIECIGFKSEYNRYYQITAIDLYTRKRVLQIVNEHSTWTTSQFLKTLESKMGFKIELIQTDNGKEFCNDPDSPKSLFEETLCELGIEYKRTRPYSPWQNGIVERSHRIDGELFYSRRRFKSEEEMYKSISRYNTRYNNIARKVLNFKTPNEMYEEYINQVA